MCLKLNKVSQHRETNTACSHELCKLSLILWRQRIEQWLPETGKVRREGNEEWYGFGLSCLKGEKWGETFISHCSLSVFPWGVVLLRRVEGKYV